MASIQTLAAPSQVLVVEDEPAISDVVATALRHQSHDVTQADDGLRGLQVATDNDYDIIVLDVMLPGIDGFEVCRRLREQNITTPVLFLTAKDEPDDRITGFVNGGDDYLTKPFTVDELVLRVAAILRRTGTSAPSGLLAVDDLTLDPASCDVHRAGERLELSPTEFGLLHYLMTNTGVVVSKGQILAEVWDYGYEGSDNVVELYIGYLRRKINAHGRPLIHTRRGLGYIMRTEAEA